MTQACTTFDRFFLVEQLNHQKRFDLTKNLLGLQYSYQDKYLFVLIADFTHPTRTGLEIVPAESYKARVEKYGTVHYQYYGLLPKLPDININLFREFFKTDIGLHVIQLSLSAANARNLKSRINSLLIPNFFMHNKTPKESTQNNWDFLETSHQDIISIHPDLLKEKFLNVKHAIHSLSEKYPWYSLGLCIHFKNNCSLIHEITEDKTSQEMVNYCNPFIIKGLNKMKTFPLTATNEDIYAKMNTDREEDIHLPLESTSIQKTKEGNHLLELFGLPPEQLPIQSKTIFSPYAAFMAMKNLFFLSTIFLKKQKD